MNTLWKLAAFGMASAMTLAVAPASAQTGGATTPPPPTNGEAAPDASGADPQVMREMMREMMEEMLSGERQANPRRDDRNRGPRWSRDRDRGWMAHHGRRDRWRGMGDDDRRGAMHGTAMKILFSVMDADGDGVLSLREVQDFHARIFNGVDGNADGRIDMGEIRSFFHGRDDDRGEDD